MKVTDFVRSANGQCEKTNVFAPAPEWAADLEERLGQNGVDGEKDRVKIKNGFSSK